MMNWLANNMQRPGGMGFGVMGGRYSHSLKAFSVPFFEHADAEKVNEINYGGKILLPSSTLDALIRLNIPYPMLFKVINPSNGKLTCCGVQEFSAEEGRVYFPQWLMQQLNIKEGDNITIESCILPKASYAKLKPQNLDFLQISNPRAMLEVELRKFACLSVNDRIAVRYNEQTLEFLVMELKPKNAVCIIECDVNLEFDAPEGYVDDYEKKKFERTEKPPAPPMEEDEIPEQPKAFSAFQGSGARLDGKCRGGRGGRTESSSSIGGMSINNDSIPITLPSVRCREDYVPGTMTFPRYDYKCRLVMEKELEEKAKALTAPTTMSAFEGSGKALRARK